MHGTSLLMGRNIWQNGEASTHWSVFPRDLVVYPDLLGKAGYGTGYTGKGWSPGNWEVRGRRRISTRACPAIGTTGLPRSCSTWLATPPA